MSIDTLDELKKRRGQIVEARVDDLIFIVESLTQAQLTIELLKTERAKVSAIAKQDALNDFTVWLFKTHGLLIDESLLRLIGER